MGIYLINVDFTARLMPFSIKRCTKI
jgi:hypothetical protein